VHLVCFRNAPSMFGHVLAIHLRFYFRQVDCDEEPFAQGFLPRFPLIVNR